MKGIILKEPYKYITRCKKYDEVSCCKGMVDDLFDEVCEFDITYRRFYIHLIRKDEDYWQTLSYCPYCGAKLPSLGDEYEDALEEALGKDYCDIKSDEIPEEFKSDKWWKKRHLDDPKILEEWRKKQEARWRMEIEYADALEEALGKDYCDIKSEEIPEEFKSDKWWKKRHLDDPKILEEWRKKHNL